MATSNVTPPSQSLTFTIQAQGTVWAGSDTPISYWISTDYNTSTFIPQANNEWPPNYWRGWDFVTDITNNPPYPIPIYAYGLYKMTTNHSSEYFYLDFRDDRYGYYQLPTNGHEIDLWIKYNASTNEFSYSSSGSAFQEFMIISNGEYIPIWEMKEKGQPHTALFPNYWGNCLAVINDSNNHPRLVWGTYPDEIGIFEYRIYRKYGNSPWDDLVDIDADVYEYIDGTVQIIPPGGQTGVDVNYYVKGLYMENPPNPTETEPTNTVSVNVGGKEIEKQSGTTLNSNNPSYSLYQNYPNPFNPITTINYVLPQSGFVSLNLYDLLGNKIAALVNEVKGKGSHSIEFNASELPSGLYLYKIESGKFQETRKMIFLK